MAFTLTLRVGPGRFFLALLAFRTPDTLIKSQRFALGTT
jgi:hypothetical protein